MQTTKLTSKSILPLTCSRSGSCCFGKAVMLNPWELLQFSIEKKVTQKEFRDAYTDFGGIRLTFNGKEDKKGQQACSQYIENKGCSVHLGRPLACRLYPLGRQIQFDKAQYMHEGNQFPCLTDCAEVLDLPKDTFIFCNFNTRQKMNCDTLVAWQSIVQKCPDSVLWLLDPGPDMRQEILKILDSIKQRVFFAHHIFRPRFSCGRIC